MILKIRKRKILGLTFAPISDATSFSCSSDERLKEDIAGTGNTLSWIRDFRVRDCTLKADQARMTPRK